MSGILKNIPLDIGDLCLSIHGNQGSGLLMTFGRIVILLMFTNLRD